MFKLLFLIILLKDPVQNTLISFLLQFYYAIHELLSIHIATGMPYSDKIFKKQFSIDCYRNYFY